MIQNMEPTNHLNLKAETLNWLAHLLGAEKNAWALDAEP